MYLASSFAPFYGFLQTEMTDPYRFKYFIYASVNSTCAQRPLSRADPRALAFFFLPWMANSRGVGAKKDGKCPFLRQHCNIFH